MTPAISVAGLTRNDRGQLAVDHVKSTSNPGRSPGCSAGTGAGKTTLMRIVAGR